MKEVFEAMQRAGFIPEDRMYHLLSRHELDALDKIEESLTADVLSQARRDWVDEFEHDLNGDSMDDESYEHVVSILNSMRNS